MNEKKIIIFLFLSLFTTSFIFGTVSAEDTVLIGKGTDYEDYLNTTTNETFVKVFLEPINFFNGSDYTTINNSIVQSGCTYDYCVKDGLYEADFKEIIGMNDSVKFFYEDSYITYTPLELTYINEENSELISNLINVEGYANENTFTYSGIYGSGTNLIYEYFNSHLKESLIIEDNSILPQTSFNNTNETYLNLMFRIDSRGYVDSSWVENELFLTGYIASSNESMNRTEFNETENRTFSGFIEVARGGTSELTFRLHNPVAIDSNGSIIGLEYSIYSIEGEKYISILTPYEWLVDENRVYPVEIDPSTGLLDISGYGTASKLGPSISYSFNNFGSQIQMGTYVDASGYQQTRNYVNWHFSNSLEDKIQQANIDSAIAEISVVQKSGSNPKIEVYEFPFLSQSLELNPSSQSEIFNLFNLIDDGDDVWELANPPLLSKQISLDESDLEDKIDDGQDLILGFKGFEHTLLDGRVWIKSTGSGKPVLSIVYTCVQVSGCNDDCDINLPNGNTCHCSQECSSGMCSGGVCVAAPVCGNGVVESGEQCDDGDAQGGDGCSSSCQVESGWTCSGFPMSTCQQIPTEPEYDGQINVYVHDSSGVPLQGLYTYLNGGNSEQTSGDGWTQYILSNVEGSEVQTVEVKCSSQGPVCGSDSTKISYEGDVDSLYFTCDICSPKKDLLIDKNELTFKKVGSDTQVNVTVNSIGMNENIDVTLRKICAGNKISLPTQTTSISAGQKKIVSFTSNFDGCEKLEVSVEEFAVESDKNNNHIKDFFVIDPVKVHLTTSTGFSLVNQKINEFIGDFGQVVSTAAEADLRIYIGVNANKQVLESQGWLVNELVSYNGLKEGLPYNGLIAQRKVSGQTAELYVFGNDLDGTVAAVRRMIDERDEYLNKNKLGDNKKTYLSETDVDAISVYDYFHTDENDGFYKKDNADFAKLVENVLRKQTFNLAIKRVLTANDQTSLRLKNVNHELSPQFKEFANERPVVMSGGIFSNLFTFEDKGDGLALDIAHIPRDVWEIEMTGGPNTECDNCPDYTYQDLVDYYWPALVAGVQYYTGEQTIDYVGHSNGCRVALSSLSDYQETGSSDIIQVLNDDGGWSDMQLQGSSSNPVVDTFIGIACPGELNDDTHLSLLVRGPADNPFKDVGEIVMEDIDETHIEMKDYLKAVLTNTFGPSQLLINVPLTSLAGMFSDDKISKNLMEHYNDLAYEENSNFDLSGLEINRLRLYNGNILFFGHDGVVPTDDWEVIMEEIESNDKNTIEEGVFIGSPFDVDHVFIKSKDKIKKMITGEDLS